MLCQIKADWYQPSSNLPNILCPFWVSEVNIVAFLGAGSYNSLLQQLWR